MLPAQSPPFLRRKSFCSVRLYSRPNKKIMHFWRQEKLLNELALRSCVEWAVFLDLKSALAADFLVLVTRGCVCRARELSSSHTNLACFLVARVSKRDLWNTRRQWQLEHHRSKGVLNGRMDYYARFYPGGGHSHGKGWGCSSSRFIRGDAYLSLLRCSNAGGNATTFCR